MKKVTPTQKWNRILILSNLLEKPMRYNELWGAVKPHIKSKDTFGKSLDALMKRGIIERVESNPNHVIYRVSRGAGFSEDLSLARRATPWGSVEFIADCMVFLIESPVFLDKEEAAQAAIDFWIERYRNLCLLDALFSLMEKDGEDLVLTSRKSYQVTEDKFFDVILMFKKKYPHLFRTVLEKKLFLKGVELKPSWISAKLDEFLKTYYPKAYEKLSNRDRGKIYFELLAKEKEKEYIHCLKKKREFPRWVCRFCEFHKYSPTCLLYLCRYRKAPSVREKILAKHKMSS